ncbi:MAG: CHC2 zinc finger domain-containing protein [Candidatus Paceibacteria bacterium]
MLLSQIIGKDLEVHKKDENRYVALCPWHDDTTPSLNIHNGKNLFKCFVCGKGGKGAISYIMQSRNISFKDAINLLKTNYDVISTVNNEFEEETEYLLPLDRFKKPSFEHYIYGIPFKIYSYRNLEGRLLGYTCRYITDNGGKVVLPYNYIMMNGSPEWVFRGFKTPSLPYKAELLSMYPNAPVCLVEGEKAADCGNKFSNYMIFLSWVGGANAVNQVDWTCLKNRHVILIPDHDKEAKNADGTPKSVNLRPGNKAMLDIATHIQRIASKIEFVVIPEDYPNKWDIADRSWKQGDLRYWVNKYKQNYFKLKL